MNIDAVRASIDNILKTHPGERVMLPPFASRLRHILFENIATELSLFFFTEVKRVIERWDDRVQVLMADYVADPDRNEFRISLGFSVRGLDGIFQHQVTL